MCGIAGFAGYERATGRDERALRAMCDAIRHRGPDDDGMYVGGRVALGMRRLSIIDVAGGHQPMANEDGSIRIVFNGEIYNYRALREKLLAAGHVFATRSDTESIVHLYEDGGDALVHQLRGMFGFALWDERRGRLLLARDRLGIKPLYYAAIGGGIVFASELRALLTLPDFAPEIDDHAVALYLALGYVPDPFSIFRGVRKLPPGHTVSWSASEGLAVRRYWSPPPSVDSLTVVDAARETRRLFEEAVQCHLESEVPLGAFLSGGVDSSAVVAAMARSMDRPVRTFTIGFTEPEFDETTDAALVARALSTDHTELTVRPDADALIEEVVCSFDEPFADSSALPTYIVAQLARQEVTVALSGDGGDELFGGYARYREVLGLGELRSASARAALRAMTRRLPQATPWRNRMLDLARTRRGRYASTVALALRTDEGGVARPEVARRLDDMDALLEVWFEASDPGDFAGQMMRVDLASYLPGDILTKVDRTSMAASLEARVPLLDHVFAEHALRLPSALKVRPEASKIVFREAIRDLVPPEVLTKRKQGFGVPLGRWFRHELAHRLEAVVGSRARIGRWVEPAAAQRLIREHRMRRRDHSHALWRLLALELWLGFLEGGALAGPNERSQNLVTVVRRAGRTPAAPVPS
jgi:asparagine synthase (glutamine-hydrolysing)